MKNKTKILIAIVAFVLVVAISVPIAFGFVKDNHPEVDIPSNSETTGTSDKILPEVELGIIGGVCPGDVEFSTQSEAEQKENNSQTGATTSNKTETPSKITGSAIILDTTTYVENQGKVEVAEEQEYEKVHVNSSINLPPPSNTITGKPVNPDEYDFDTDNIDKEGLWDELSGDDRPVIEVEAEKQPINPKDYDQIAKDAEELFGVPNVFEAEYANHDEYACDIDELFGR